jgi:tripartite-type tricarboxylate transporter receptor subunit TctC
MRAFGIRKLTLFLAVGVALCAPAQAQDAYPSRTITVIVGYSTGSGPDAIARHFAEELRKKSGRTVVVDNRPGALTNIAAQRVAQSKPDGYTIFITPGNSSWAINSAIFKELPFNPLEDFTPVTSLVTTPFAFAVAEGSPINSLTELTTALKAKEGRAKYAFPNSISLASAELYKKLTGVEAQGVAYKSIADSHSALASGEVDFFVTDLTFRKGKLLAMTVAKPSAVAPGVPSAKEAGLHDFDLFSWFGMWLPKNAPKDVVDKLTLWMDESVLTEETRAKFAPMGFEPWPGVRGEALREFTKAEMAKWKTVAEIAKIPSP